jgi:hypothetical protein
LKTFLDGVFDEVMDPAKHPEFRQELVKRLAAWSLDQKTFVYLVSQWAGAPRQAVDVTASGKLTLEQIVSGKVPSDEPADATPADDGEASE